MGRGMKTTTVFYPNVNPDEKAPETIALLVSIGGGPGFFVFPVAAFPVLLEQV
jgi:hypothetical protein